MQVNPGRVIELALVAVGGAIARDVVHVHLGHVEHGRLVAQCPVGIVWIDQCVGVEEADIVEGYGGGFDSLMTGRSSY
ncbi:MAG: hypothetical protein QF921_14610 [Pseudomonadales bacterium]|nr:hypothetical protein [Pseudomonadales bacterium]MDP6469672.1 hypothetical protein [Pseudomonadales bacterium]MDP6828913.1 hypothetical protein [Pseudomonadales bacterium]MDP6972713.1 hypothetical protein [Pseudomonadales bacterium]